MTGSTGIFVAGSDWRSQAVEWERNAGANYAEESPSGEFSVNAALVADSVETAANPWFRTFFAGNFFLNRPTTVI